MSILKVNENFLPSERAAFLQETLNSAGFRDISWVSSTGSTNSDLLEAGLKGAENLSVMIADHQTAGRGRRDREWISEENSALLMSVLFRTHESTGHLSRYSMKLSLSACQVLHELGFDQIRIKWPNDLIVNHENRTSKLAGVLAQTMSHEGQTLVVVGIGLNVISGNLKQSLPDRDVVALSEIDDPPDRVLLAAKILENLAVLEDNESIVLGKYTSVLDTLGRKVRIQTEKEEITGEAVTVTPTGSLIVDLDNGESKEIFVGDVIHLHL
ncbi:MAG: biotin--[acetyl-CoA-carboxylase] ligase [Actinomycetota bacterium]